MRASELLLIVRAQNQASAALRRVAGDLRGLSASEGLRRRGQSLQVARNQIQLQKQIAQNELSSIENGRRALALQRAQTGAVLNESRARITTAGLANEQRRIEAAQIAKQVEIQRRRRTISPVQAIRREQLQMIERAQIQLAALNREEELLAQRAGVAAGALSRQALALREVEAREIDAANRAGVLRNRIANLGDRYRINSQQIAENNKAIRAIPYERISRFGSAMQHGARVAEYAGLVLGGSLAVMANNAAKFETSVTLAATQTRRIGQSFIATAANSKTLQASIRSLMMQFPASADEMSQAAYDIYSSLNVTLPGGIKLLKLFNQAAVAGQTSLGEVTQAAITVMNDFRIKVPQMGKAFQTMFAAVRFGRMTFKQFVAMMPQLSPAFSAAGYGLREMAQAAAFMTRVMPNTRMAATSLARLTEMFARKDFIEGARKSGAVITDFHNRLLPLPTIIDRLAKAFPEVARAIKAGKGDVALQNFFKTVSALGGGEGTAGTIQGRRGFIFLSTQAKLAHQIYGQVAKDQDEFTNALKAMEVTTGVRWGTFVNQLKALALAIGADVVPALLKMAGPIQRVVKWWENLDEGTRRLIARIATFSAGFLLVGGAFMYVLGTATRLFAILGKGVGPLGAISAIFIGISFAVKALTGDLRGLSDILDMIANFAFGSFEGFAVTMGIAAVAAVRLTTALKGLAAASAVGGEAGAAGGMLGMLRGARAAPGALKELYQVRRLEGAGRLMAGLAASAAMVPGPLWVAGAAIAAAAGGLALWKLHMREVRKDAEEVKRSFDIGAAPRRRGDIFQQLVGSTEDVERARINVRNIQRQIADMRDQLKGARGRRRAQLLDDLYIASLDLIQAQNTLGQVVGKNNRQFRALSESFALLQPAQQHIVRLRNELAQLERIRKISPLSPGINQQIDQVRERLKAVTDQTRASAQGLSRAFSSVVTGLARMGKISMPSPRAMQDMFRIAMQRGRMLTLPEMRAIIRAELDPASIRKMPAQLQAQFKRAVRVRVEAETDARKATKALRDFSVLGMKPFGTAKITAVPEVQKAKKAFQALKAPISKTVHLHAAPDPQQMGRDISAGIQAGMTPITATVIEKVIKTPIKDAIESHSPSKWAMREVGKPIVQGISVGILQNVGLLEKAATASIELFQSAAIQKAQEGKKKVTDAMLIGDVRSQTQTLTQFNNAIARLTRRHVPRALIDELAAQGPAAAKLISQISRMSEKELRAYVRAWIRANNQVKRSFRATQEDMKRAAKEFHDQLKSTLRDMFESLRETTAGQFGDLFAGIDPATYGEGLKEARAAYASQMNDFRGQISDLNKSLIDAQAEASQRLIDAIKARKDELQQAFGQLFGGDWLTGATVQTKLDWGKKLGFDDLQKDLQSQVDKFKRWRELLTSLAARIPPELGAQLEALGPEAVDKLEILNSGTNAQIAQYVATWQDGQNQMQAIANKTTVDTSDITARMADIAKQIADVVAQMAALQYPHELTGQDLINDLQKQMDQWNEYQGLLQTLIDAGLPAEMIEQLEAMGPQAIPMLKALVGMTGPQLDEYVKLWQKKEDTITEDTLKHLNRQLELWFDYGVNIAQNIVKGIRSQGDYLADYFQQLIKSLIEQTSLPPVPPTRPTGAAGPTYIGAPTGPYGQGASYVNPPADQRSFYSMTVNQAEGESLPAALEKATFRLANKRAE